MKCGFCKMIQIVNSDDHHPAPIFSIPPKLQSPTPHNSPKEQAHEYSWHIIGYTQHNRVLPSFLLFFLHSCSSLDLTARHGKIIMAANGWQSKSRTRLVTSDLRSAMMMPTELVTTSVSPIRRSQVTRFLKMKDSNTVSNNRRWWPIGRKDIFLLNKSH